MYTGPVEDRLAIRERIETYSHAVFLHDADLWISNWAEDGVWHLPSIGIDISGRANIRAAWEQAMSAYSMAGFFAVPGAIEVSGDTATARSYTQEILVTTDGALRKIVGAYDDALVKRDGAWLFARRSYNVLHDEKA
ncbi:MAG: nuclear transport factor 2 family protein [Caulobacteraceae bacterium]|nr:nuclear transport factor 2 family protein [Caulobacteraceae bacterium]